MTPTSTVSGTAGFASRCFGVVTFRAVLVWPVTLAVTLPNVTRVVAGPDEDDGRKLTPVTTTGSFPSCEPTFGLTEVIATRLPMQVYVNFAGVVVWIAPVPGLTVTTTFTVSGTDESASVRDGVRTTI